MTQRTTAALDVIARRPQADVAIRTPDRRTQEQEGGFAVKTYRQTFEEDYRPVQEPKADGSGFRTRYVYIGNWHLWDVSGERLSAVKRLMALSAALGAAIFLIGALIPSPLTWNRYVGLATGLGLAAVLLEIVGVIQFCAAKPRVPRQYFGDINAKLKLAPLAHAILLAFATAASAAAMVGGPVTLRDALVPVCFLASALAAAGIFTLYRSMPQKVVPNDAAYQFPIRKADAEKQI